MNEDVYVKFKTAQLLKEKGFDWAVRACYQNSEFRYASPGDWNKFSASTLCSAPNQQMACRWLREVHKIDISVTPDDGSWWIKVTELESWSSIFDGRVLNSDDIKYAYEGDTSTKEGCYEAGLEYALKNLI